MKHHPIADIWPMMDQAQLQDLADDIKKNGQLQFIWLYEGMILDGRNRYAACQLAGIQPKTKDYTGDEPTAFAVSLNDKRRHMNKGSLAAVAVELLPFFEADAARRRKETEGRPKKQEEKTAGFFSAPQSEEKDKEKLEEKFPQVSREPQARTDAANAMGVNERYIQDAKKIKQEAPDVFEKLKAGKISVQDAKREVAKIPVDDWRKDERVRQELVKKGSTIVANAQHDKNLICWAEREGIAVRIDRGTRYGNPFVMGEDGTRDDVCDAFEMHYLPHKPSINSRIKSGELCGKVLVCHCYPERCHGNCLADLANMR
jgi:ParB-like chromosome segregation protein Spo0J